MNSCEGHEVRIFLSGFESRGRSSPSSSLWWKPTQDLLWLANSLAKWKQMLDKRALHSAILPMHAANCIYFL